MQKRTFSIRPEFSMTNIKVQGQIFEYVDGNLRTLVLLHEMLYVAFLRVKIKNSLKVLLHKQIFATLDITWTKK